MGQFGMKLLKYKIYNKKDNTDSIFYIIRIIII